MDAADSIVPRYQVKGALCYCACNGSRTGRRTRLRVGFRREGCGGVPAMGATMQQSKR